MKPISIWFGGAKPLKIYYTMKENAKSVTLDRNIDYLTNTSSLKIKLSEITVLELLFLNEMVGHINIDKVYCGKKNCNMDIIKVPNEYLDTLDKMEKIFSSIESEEKINLGPYYPFALIQYDVTIYLNGYEIYQFFGTDLDILFKEDIDSDNFTNKIFELFYSTFYKALFNRIGTTKKQQQDYVKIFMNDYHYKKISDDEIIMLDMVKYPEKEINFHFIDSEDDISEFSKKMKNANLSDVKVSFLMNTTLFTFIHLIKFVTDHQDFKDVLITSNYRIGLNLDNYKTRIQQLFEELISHRVYQLKSDIFDPMISSFFLTSNNLIKYHIEMSLEELTNYIPILERNENDINGEFEIIKKILKISEKSLMLVI